MQISSIHKKLNESSTFETMNCVDIKCTGTNHKVWIDVTNYVKYTRCTKCWNITITGVDLP